MSKGIFYPLEIVRGETLEFEFDVQLLGERVDPADVTIVGQFSRQGTLNPLSFTITESDDDPYVWVVSYSALESSALTATTYMWEVRMTDNETSKVTSLFYGTLEVSQGVVGTGIPPSTPPTNGGWVNA